MNTYDTRPKFCVCVFIPPFQLGVVQCSQLQRFAVYLRTFLQKILIILVPKKKIMEYVKSRELRKQNKIISMLFMFLLFDCFIRAGGS